MTIFSTGDRVRIKNSHPPGHRRTPEELAYGFDGTPKRELYRVRLSQIELWDEYQGSSDDTLDLEIYDHWLEKVED